MKNLLVKAYHFVPIYELDLWVVAAHKPRLVAESMPQFRLKMSDHPNVGHGEAFCVYGGGAFGLFFRNRPNHNTVAHEVRHCVDFMLDLIGHEVRAGSDEAATYLTGYISDCVYRVLKKARIRVSL